MLPSHWDCSVHCFHRLEGCPLVFPVVSLPMMKTSENGTEQYFPHKRIICATKINLVNAKTYIIKSSFRDIYNNYLWSEVDKDTIEQYKACTRKRKENKFTLKYASLEHRRRHIANILYRPLTRGNLVTGTAKHMWTRRPKFVVQHCSNGQLIFRSKGNLNMQIESQNATSYLMIIVMFDPSVTIL